MKNKRVIIGVGVSVCLALTSFWYFQNNLSNDRRLNDEALLSIIKNDQEGFENFIASGGKLDASLVVEGRPYMVGELLVKYERVDFIKYVSARKMPLPTGLLADTDMWSLAVAKNNPNLLQALMASNPLYKLNSKYYGTDERNLLHLASAQCSYKVIDILHRAGMNWDDKDKNGVTPLTLAADHECLQALSYWKEHGANFNAKDGRGMTALSILNKKKDAALVAFAQSFTEKRGPASVVVVAAPQVPNFYKKRLIPKDNLADRAHLIGPEDRPDEATETAEYSEFSD